MFTSFFVPMIAERSRNKERLEASLSGLCELELLKQRQEARVLSALRLGESASPCRAPWTALRAARCALEAATGDSSDQHDSLQRTPLGLKTSLEQQVAELNVNTEVKTAHFPASPEDSPLTSEEFHFARHKKALEPKHVHSVAPCSVVFGPEGTEESGNENTTQADSQREASANEVFVEIRVFDPSQEDFQQAQKVETYILGLIQRQALATRPLKPRTSLAHDTRAVTVGRQSSFCCKEDLHSPKQVSVQDITPPSQCSEETPPQAYHNLDQDLNLGARVNEGPPPPYNHFHLQQNAQHQPGLLQRPRQPSTSTPHSTVQNYASFRVLQVHKDSSNSEPESPQPIYHYPPGLSTHHQLPIPDEQLVNAQYIPAHPCRASTRAYAHHHSNPHKGSGVHKPNRSTYSPERGNHYQEQQSTASQIQSSRSRGGPKKCRSSEDRSGATRKPGKKACRSQSENSLQRVQERKYNTVERDGGGSGSGGRGSRSSQSRSKKQTQAGGNYRRWQSTLEISQDEAELSPVQAPVQGSSASNQKEHCGRRTRKSRSTQPSYTYQHQQHAHHHPSMEYQSERDQAPLCQHPSEDYPNQGQAETESSTSEVDSPDSSSLTSDSDESGGLVWPQQLPPQLSLPVPSVPPGAPLQPKAFVKIKASHALKKKILRFRTGSLKLMTTV